MSHDREISIDNKLTLRIDPSFFSLRNLLRRKCRHLRIKCHNITTMVIPFVCKNSVLIESLLQMWLCVNMFNIFPFHVCSDKIYLTKKITPRSLRHILMLEYAQDFETRVVCSCIKNEGQAFFRKFDRWYEGDFWHFTNDIHATKMNYISKC